MNICWLTIYVNDMEASLKFYTEIMGMSVLHSFSPKSGMEIYFLNTGSIQLELIYDSENKNITYGKDISVGFETASLTDKIKELKEKGIQSIVGPISPTPTVSFIYITDPNGLKTQIVEKK
ncbi:MAG: VOC family protein [Bacteroidales bacterium]|nr:VOC family protein [Bacteroidales bacterium]